MQNENERVHLVPSDMILCEIATVNSSWNHPGFHIRMQIANVLFTCLYVLLCEIC